MASSFTRFLDHTQRRITVGRTPLDEWSVRRRDLYLTTHNTHNKRPCHWWDSNPQPQQAAAADLRLRPRGQWDRHLYLLPYYKWREVKWRTSVECVHYHGFIQSGAEETYVFQMASTRQWCGWWRWAWAGGQLRQCSFFLETVIP